MVAYVLMVQMLLLSETVTANFIADRNGIARVWMDHALWPLITTSLYINQTGDIEILKKQVPYLKMHKPCAAQET